MASNNELCQIQQTAKQQEWGSEVRDYLCSHTEGKINLSGQISFQAHRCGWMYVLDLLEKFHNPDGITFAGFLENNFLWDEENLLKTGLLPFRKKWIGIIHNPPNIPDWFCSHDSPLNIISKLSFRESLPNCLGFFALSEYMAEFLRKELKKQVSVLYHPTEIPDKVFNIRDFLANKEKKVLSIGWWLRKLNSIFLLPLDTASGFTKIRLVGFPEHSKVAAFVEQLRNTEIEKNSFMFIDKYSTNTKTIHNLSNVEYDRLLSNNIVLLDLYDSSANNTIIECMARKTPILVPLLPAVREYLGEEYPLYFTSLEQAAEMATDWNLINRTHEYLMESGVTNKITGDAFCKAFLESTLYSSIKKQDINYM